MKRIEIIETELVGVKLIKPLSNFEDFRGTFLETWNANEYEQLGVTFVEDDVCVSSKNVLAGLHGDEQTWKLMATLLGKTYNVVLNCDPQSPQFHKWQAFVLSQQNQLQLLVPPKFANGCLVLSDIAVRTYKQSEYYNRRKQFTIRWNDPELNIYWPCSNPIQSLRDSTA